MIKTTKQIDFLYEDIQRKLYYMVPEKFDELYLYASVYLDGNNNPKGEFYFYYIPKGILKRKPISVYEIPDRFNIEEKQYLKLVDMLYARFQLLNIEYSKILEGNCWTNVTIKIKNNKFKATFDYEDLDSSPYSSYERHILWRYYVLGISLEQCTREEREIIKKYNSGVKILGKKDEYEANIYIGKVQNIVDYTNYDEQKEYVGYVTDDDISPMHKNSFSKFNFNNGIENQNKNLYNNKRSAKEELKANTKLFKIRRKDKTITNASSFESFADNTFALKNQILDNNRFNQILKK